MDGSLAFVNAETGVVARIRRAEMAGNVPSSTCRNTRSCWPKPEGPVPAPFQRHEALRRGGRLVSGSVDLDRARTGLVGRGLRVSHRGLANVAICHTNRRVLRWRGRAG